MLRLFINDYGEDIREIQLASGASDFIQDIDGEFLKIKLSGDEIEQRAIEIIDKGRYESPTEFIDRYGHINSINNLSTGCKALILTFQKDSSIVLLDECGFNARDMIIGTLQSGNVVISDTGLSFNNNHYNGSDKINVQLDGYKFTSLDRLNRYIFEERPFEPDLSKEGIECIS